jgi:phage shock protein A
MTEEFNALAQAVRDADESHAKAVDMQAKAFALVSSTETTVYETRKALRKYVDDQVAMLEPSA